MLLRLATSKFGKPASILSDSGSCFVGRNGIRGRWKSDSRGL